uniref:Uncharacterized protein n=1 Tax=Mesocestoides corti TaxID=53468 RepID=A0A5K3F8K6_MESCO
MNLKLALGNESLISQRKPLENNGFHISAEENISLTRIAVFWCALVSRSFRQTKDRCMDVEAAACLAIQNCRSSEVADLVT